MQSILDHPIISQRYFFPQRQTLPGARMVETDGARLACYLHAPHPGAGTIVHFHGNGEVVADYLGPVVEAFGKLGMNVFLAEYRGYGGSDGEPALAAMLADVPAIVRAAGDDPRRLILFGRSVGSIYAIHAAARFPDIGGLIIESGVASPLERILMRATPAELGTTLAALRAAAAEHLDHERILRGFERPLLVMHTRYDSVVSSDNAQRLHAWAAGNKRLRIFEDGDHHNILPLNADAYLDEMERLIEVIEADSGPLRAVRA